MPPTSPNDASIPPTTNPPDRNDQYAALKLTDGIIVIYDQENHRAWIQSDTTMALEQTA